MLLFIYLSLNAKIIKNYLQISALDKIYYDLLFHVQDECNYIIFGIEEKSNILYEKDITLNEVSYNIFAKEMMIGKIINFYLF